MIYKQLSENNRQISLCNQINDSIQDKYYNVCLPFCP